MNERNNLVLFIWRIASAHVIAYFLAGVLALTVMAYGEWFAAGSIAGLMRPVDSPWVAMGPALQILRGMVIALVLYPFREVFLLSRNGWLKLWLLIVGLCYISTIGPTFGSFEGYIYTQASLAEHLLGIPEMMIYTFLFSFSVCGWYRKPRKAWTVLSMIGVVLIMVMSGLGVWIGLQG